MIGLQIELQSSSKYPGSVEGSEVSAPFHVGGL